jgi:hypothetical protein
MVYDNSLVTYSRPKENEWRTLAQTPPWPTDFPAFRFFFFVERNKPTEMVKYLDKFPPTATLPVHVITRLVRSCPL